MELKSWVWSRPDGACGDHPVDLRFTGNLGRRTGYWRSLPSETEEERYKRPAEENAGTRRDRPPMELSLKTVVGFIGKERMF